VPELSVTVRFRLWLESPSGIVFGPGRAQLLAKIEETGSLNQAAKALGISYRAAWGKLKKTEEILGFALCNKTRGRSGYSLTDEGKRMLNDFLGWQACVQEHACRSARERLSWTIAPELERHP
jgi:molybdate transport system regulatory protein